MATVPHTLWKDVDRIRRKWPGASDIRLEDDKCPDCRREGRYYSYQIESDIDKVYQNKAGVWYEKCGYFCCACGWGNAGSRLMNL